MNHLRPISRRHSPVERAMDIGQIMTIIGTVLSTIGALLLSLSPLFAKDVG